jgi:hypothetical protein
MSVIIDGNNLIVHDDGITVLILKCETNLTIHHCYENINCYNEENINGEEYL